MLRTIDASASIDKIIASNKFVSNRVIVIPEVYLPEIFFKVKIPFPAEVYYYLNLLIQ